MQKGGRMRFQHQNKKTVCIQHAGQVVNITPVQIEVNIVSLSACAACHAKTFCATFDQKEKNITIPNIGQNVSIGDHVNVQLKRSLGIQAVVLAYLLPVIAVIMAVLIFTSVGVPEPIAALLSLGVLTIYYIILYLFKDKLKKVYNFQLVKQ